MGFRLYRSLHWHPAFGPDVFLTPAPGTYGFHIVQYAGVGVCDMPSSEMNRRYTGFLPVVPFQRIERPPPASTPSQFSIDSLNG